MKTILELKRLTKTYKALTAVDELSLSVPQGVCFGLLGPNGAGKTTTLEMIEGILEPTSGEILFHGVPAGRDFRQNMGIQFQSTALPDLIHVSEVLELFASFYKRHADIEELKTLCNLGEFWDRDASKLSGGQRQRLLLALALVGDPEIVFLDEPTTGLDPSARRDFWHLVRVIRSRGKTVVLTTHYMEEAYELCDEIAIMDRGKIIAQGPPDRLLREHFQGLSIRIPKGELKLADLTGITNDVYELSDAFEVQTTAPENTMRLLLDRKVPLEGIQIRTKNLDDLFLKLTGRAVEGEEAKAP